MKRIYNKSIKCIDCGKIVLHAHGLRKRCDHCGKIARNKQMNESRQRNIDEVRKRGRERKKIAYKEDPEKFKIANLKYREKHRDELRERTAQWREENPEKSKESAIIYYYKNWKERKQYREQNKELLKKRSRQYDIDHPEKMRARVKRRRARKLGAVGSHTVEQFLELCKHLKYKCTYCGIELNIKNVTEDHIIPLTKGGSDDISNITPACMSCNCSKHNSLVHVFMERKKCMAL